MSTAVIPVEPKPLEKSAETKPTKQEQIAAAIDLYRGASLKPFKQTAIDILIAEIDPLDVEIRPDGIVYLPEIKYRRRLNQAFGPGGWSMIPIGQHMVRDNTIMREYALYVEGRFVSQACGEQDYIPNNPTMTYATAAEGCKSNALMRCCKDLGIASELWDPGYIEPWRKLRAVQVWVRGKQKPQWRRRDRDPFYDETGEVRPKDHSVQTVTTSPSSQPEPPAPAGEGPPPVGYSAQESPAGADPSHTITEKQAKRLFAIAKGRGMTNDQIKAVVVSAGYQSSKDIEAGARYEEICSALSSWTPDSHTRICMILEEKYGEEVGHHGEDYDRIPPHGS